MFRDIDLYYFSPTGGVKAVADLFCDAFAASVREVDLAVKNQLAECVGEVAVFALPVFGGRIPAFVSERLEGLCGNGKKAVIFAVYGTRAYEDALLELCDIVTKRGFDVVAAAAPIARHSIVPQVGAGRPDEKDAAALKDFASAVTKKLAEEDSARPLIPGNVPYRERTKASVAPIASEHCVLCGHCAEVCPLDAVRLEDGEVKTDADACILCMACTAKCPENARILPPPAMGKMREKLSAVADLYRENEFYL
ncbi:MAG: EFR1 family ferrodoxin [Firmicutes bacterium]|nr:EFR1 family ferrodoxin [Bacillota bacterium]